MRSVERLGWLDGPDPPLVFALPTDIVAHTTMEAITYQPERYSPSSGTLHAQSSLEAWRYEVAAPCAGNDLLTVAICVALAAPLLKPARLDGGGFHLYGGSSRGKTTALQVAISVWGCGADPAEAGHPPLECHQERARRLGGGAQRCPAGPR